MAWQRKRKSAPQAGSVEELFTAETTARKKGMLVQCRVIPFQSKYG